MNEDKLNKMIDEINLADIYACERVWSAWSYGTMGEGDFTPADETDLVDDIKNALRSAYEAGRNEKREIKYADFLAYYEKFIEKAIDIAALEHKADRMPDLKEDMLHFVHYEGCATINWYRFNEHGEHEQHGVYVNKELQDLSVEEATKMVAERRKEIAERAIAREALAKKRRLEEEREARYKKYLSALETCKRLGKEFGGEK